MRIGGLQPCSFIDFPGYLSAVVFTQGCNLRCAYCHNPQLVPAMGESEVPEAEVFSLLERRKGNLSGVVVSGGEPTLQEDLPKFLRKVKAMGYKTKLDTNGSRPEVVSELLRESLVDFVAVDVKVAPGVSSLDLCGVEDQAESALEVLRLGWNAGISCEARTTTVRGIHGVDDLAIIAGELVLAGVENWRLQNFRGGRVLDEKALLKPVDSEVLRRAVNAAAGMGLDVAIRKVG